MVLTELSGINSWFLPVLSIIISTVISGVVGYIVNRSLTKHFDARDAEDKRIKDEHEELRKIRAEKEREERKQDLTEAINSSIKPLENKIDDLNSKLKVNSEGTVTILRDRMKSARDLFLSRGYASDADKANWRELYQSYKSLGGNHFKEYVDQWKISVEELPPHNLKRPKRDESIEDQSQF